MSQGLSVILGPLLCELIHGRGSSNALQDGIRFPAGDLSEGAQGPEARFVRLESAMVEIHNAVAYLFAVIYN